MENNVAPISENQKHNADSPLSHQPDNAGDYSAELKKTQKFVLGRKSSLRQIGKNDKRRPRVHFNDTPECIEPSDLTHFALKPKSLLLSKSSTRMSNVCHSQTSEKLTIHRNSNTLDASRCEFNLDASISNAPNSPSSNDTSEEDACEAHETALLTDNFDKLDLKKSKSVPATRVTDIADHPKPRQKISRSSRKSDMYQQRCREMSPIPGPSTRSDDQYDEFHVTEDQPDEEEAEEEEVQDNPDEDGPIMIPFDFLNEYLHVFDNKLERAAVHVKYGPIAECTCDLYDIEDPCIKHIATEKLQYFAKTMEMIQAYSEVAVDGPEYFEAEDRILELCPNFYQRFLENPDELSDQNYYLRCFVSEQNVVKTVIQILEEEDHLHEFLRTELEIGERRCLFDDDDNDEFNLAVAFLILEYPSVFVQLCLEFDFFEITERKSIVHENRKRIMDLSELTREELIEFDEQFPQLEQQ